MRAVNAVSLLVGNALQLELNQIFITPVSGCRHLSMQLISFTIYSLPRIYQFILSTLGNNFWSESVEVGGYPLVGSYRLFSVSKQSLNIWWWSHAPLIRPSTLKLNVRSPRVSPTISVLHNTLCIILSRILLTLFVCCWNILEPCMSLSPKHPPPSHRKFELSQATQ